MKKILLTFIAIFAITIFSYGQGAFTVQGGYSWTMGMAGIEYQIGHSAIGGGWMSTTMPGSGESLNSFSAYYAWTGYKYNQSGYYLSLGFASAGYRSQMNYNYSGWTDDVVEAMGIVNIGYKIQFYSGLNIKGEVGLGWCEHAKVFTYGLTAGWTFGM